MRLYSYAASANCLKVRVLLGILRIPHETVEIDIFAGETLTREYTNLNPLRETPVLELEDGTCLTQSSAILSYLAEGTAWHGQTRAERAQVAAWMHIEQELVVPGIGGVRFRLLTERATTSDLAERLAIGRTVLNLLDQHLSTRRWLVGTGPTIADISVWAYVHLAADAALSLADWPMVRRWCGRVEGLPGLVDDIARYGANARPGVGRSVYD